MRTVSLFPSATELVAAISAENSLVGRSHRCNHPATVRDLPVVTASSLGEQASDDAKAIDSVVDDHHHGEHSYFRVMTDELAALRPDILITQSLCEVCAVPESMTLASMERLDPEPELVSLGPRTIGGIFESIERLGTSLDTERSADELRSRLDQRIEGITGRIPTGEPRPDVVCLEWTNELRCHGLWVPEIIDRLGARDGFGEPGEHGHVIEWEDIREYDPDVLIVSPCGRVIPEIIEDMEHLTPRPGWGTLSAIENDCVYLLDGELSSRHGPRVVRALELIAKMLYPETFSDIHWSRDEVVRYADLERSG